MFSTLESFDTKLSADSVEWCPIDNFRDVFVCGTYKLAEADEDDERELTQRLGKLYLFRIQNGRLNLLQSFEGAAILDMKWAHTRICNKILLGIVTSKNMLEIHELVDDWNPTLELIKKVPVEEAEETLALSLDWSMGNPMTYNCEVKIVVSTSIGTVCIFHLTTEGVEKLRSIQCHEYEAWISAFNYWDSNIIYTGGDDSRFKSFDIRVDTPVMSSKTHWAGVTSIHCNPRQQRSLASGSYDEYMRLWDTRKMSYPLSQKNLGGGIWRLKWNPFDGKHLLAACMYGGFRLLDCENFDNPQILSEYNEHTSISYGCDWSFLNSQEIVQRELFYDMDQQVALVSTCSFYDHLMNLSIVEFS